MYYDVRFEYLRLETSIALVFFHVIIYRRYVSGRFADTHSMQKVLDISVEVLKRYR